MNNTLYVNTKLFKTKLHLCYISTPKKHHFVPEVYLKRFSAGRNGFLFKLEKSNPKIFVSKKLFHVSSVCYETDGYRLHLDETRDKLNTDDPLYLENYGFKYEKEELTKLFDKLECDKEEITRTEFRKIVGIIFSLIFRTKSFKSKLIEAAKKSKLIELTEFNNRRELLKESGLTEEILKENYDLAHQRFKNKAFLSDFANLSTTKFNESLTELENEFINGSPTLLKSSSNSSFIISDSPGFFMNQTNKFDSFNGHLDFLFFQISPQTVLQIKKGKIKSLDIFQKFDYKSLSVNKVSILNQYTYLCSDEYIFGITPEELTITKKHCN